MKLNKRGKIIREGGRNVSERTDSDYYDKKLAKIVADLKACPKEWRGVFLAGICARDWRELKIRGLIKDKKRANP